MKKWLFIAALSGALAVMASALAAHAGGLDMSAQSDLRLAATYQLYHALAMGLAALAGRGNAKFLASVSAVLFLVGTLLFSGGLYLLGLSGVHGFAFMVPFGGTAFIGGWITLAIAALKME